jgi:tungstate transport system substrate-binding protein
MVSACTNKDQAKVLEIMLATTTSTDDSGLLAILIPAFEASTGFSLKYIAVGTGQALELGRNGDVDVVLVHARQREMEFVEQGFGVERREVMYNDFVILGPPNDPAGVRGMRDAAAALNRLAQTEAIFVSRGDNSGTHIKELTLWESPPPSTESWYISAGQGMGEVLMMSHELRAYTLADRGTYLFMRERLDLEVLVEGDPRLRNQYGVIAVNPARHSHVNHQGAMAFIEWLTGEEGQALITQYGKDQFGQSLFVANYSGDGQ